MEHSALFGRLCPGCGEVVGITMTDEPYIILCGGNTLPHLYDDSVASVCEREHHGWLTAHFRCKDDALAVLLAEQN